MLRGDQCAFGLRNWTNKTLHLMPTGFMAPAGSALEAELAKRCTGDHEHTPAMDGSKVTMAAGTCPVDLGAAILKAALQDAVGQAPDLASLGVARLRGELTVNLTTAAAVASVAKALYLRPEVIELHGAAPDGQLLVTGYQRRLITGCNKERELTYFNDLWGKSANCLALRLTEFTAMPGDQPLVVSILDLTAKRTERLESTFPAKLPKRLRTKTAPADVEIPEVTDADTEDEGPPRPVLPGGRPMHDGFGEKPPEVTSRQYGAIKRLHHNFAHPANTSLTRVLRRWGAQPAMIKCVRELKFHVCSEIRMPQPSRRAGLKPATHFNHWVSLDETEVIFSDGSTLNVLIIVCGASNLHGCSPDARRAPCAELGTGQGRPRARLALVGGASREHALRLDASSSRRGSQALLRRAWMHGTSYPGRSAQCERTLGEPRRFLHAPLHQAQPCRSARSHRMSSPTRGAESLRARRMLTCATADSRQTSTCSDETRASLRRCSPMRDGSTPRPPPQPWAREPAEPNSYDALLSRGSSRFKMDDVMAISRALTRNRRGPEAFPVGSVVFYWREQGAGTMSRRQLAVKGWRVPGVIVAKQGTSRYYTWPRGEPP